jgi:rubrerythrin
MLHELDKAIDEAKARKEKIIDRKTLIDLFLRNEKMLDDFKIQIDYMSRDMNHYLTKILNSDEYMIYADNREKYKKEENRERHCYIDVDKLTTLQKKYYEDTINKIFKKEDKEIVKIDKFINDKGGSVDPNLWTCHFCGVVYYDDEECKTCTKVWKIHLNGAGIYLNVEEEYFTINTPNYIFEESLFLNHPKISKLLSGKKVEKISMDTYKSIINIVAWPIEGIDEHTN